MESRFGMGFDALESTLGGGIDYQSRGGAAKATTK